MTQCDKVVQYVIDHGPCSDDELYKNASKTLVGIKVHRCLVDQAPDGIVAYEKKDGIDSIFVYAEEPPDGFVPIKIQGRI